MRRRRMRKKIIQKRRREREIYRESLHSVRDTIILVATLITTFTYTAGLSPPGGVYSDGPMKGTAVAGNRTALKVFTVCNNTALFSSVAIVLVLASIIPYKRRALARMMGIVHKVMVVSFSFMGVAYVAGGVVTMREPPSPRHRSSLGWPVGFLIAITCGTLGSTFVALGILFVKKKVLKRKWRRTRPGIQYSKNELDSGDSDSSLISDLEFSSVPFVGVYS